MMSTQDLLTLLTVFVCVNADIEKLSSTVIRNGSDVYGIFARHSDPLRLFNVQRLNGNGGGFNRNMSLENDPAWADLTSDLPRTFDVNYIGNNIVVYYTALHKKTKRPAIGVAFAGSLEWFNDEYTFFNMPEPLVVAHNGEHISQPSLRVFNGVYSLMYLNSSAVSFPDTFMSIGLQPNGLQLSGDEQPRQCWYLGC